MRIGKHVRQLTFGLGVADYEGVYLPDDTIAFASSRVEQSVPCWYTEVSNLYKMNRNGSFIRRLAVDQVHAWHPQPTDDGRIVYSRWDYNDRAQVFPQALFQMNLDGTGQAALYGANSWFPTSLLHARQVPGTQRFLAVASGHHTWQQGKVVEIDPNLGRNEGEGMAFVAPRRQHPYERVDAAMQQREVFAYPYPLGDEEFIASWAGPDRVGKNRGYHEHFDLCWFDYAGAREWLAGDDELSCLSAIPLRPRPRGHVRPDTVDYDAREGAFYVEDVYAGGGMRGVARGEADRLRVVELRYRAASIGCNLNHGPGGGALTSSPISTGLGAWDVKAIVGETPIQPDGSAFFLTPAMKSLYFQVLNRKGEAIQTMRSWDTVQPGEVKSCVGCHSYDQNTAPPISARPTMALRKGKARLESFATGWTGFDFDAHVQPILDAKCVKCHNGSDPRRMDLRGNLADHDPLALRKWTRAYLALTASRLTARPDVMWLGNPDGPWVRWINKMSQVTPLPPYSSGAAVSPLMKLLRNGHRDAKLTDEDLRILAAWIDLLVPFGGDYYRGAAWTPEQTAYYRYYEGKRRVNEIAEARELVRHRAGIAVADWFAAEARDRSLVGTGRPDDAQAAVFTCRGGTRRQSPPGGGDPSERRPAGSRGPVAARGSRTAARSGALQSPWRLALDRAAARRQGAAGSRVHPKRPAIDRSSFERSAAKCLSQSGMQRLCGGWGGSHVISTRDGIQRVPPRAAVLRPSGNRRLRRQRPSRRFPLPVLGAGTRRSALAGGRFRPRGSH